MRSSLLTGSAVALGAALVMWSCGGGSSYSSPAPAPTPATPSSVNVTIVGSSGNKAYQPNPVMAKAGDTISFKNDDTKTHRVVMDDGSADVGEIAPGATKSMTLKGTGGNFHCTLHSSMVGSVNGTPPEPPPCNDPYGYGC